MLYISVYHYQRNSSNRPFAPLFRDTEITECFIIFLFADPGGIGFAFHWAGKAKRNKPKPFGQIISNSIVRY